MLYEGQPHNAFQDLVDDDSVFYLTHVAIAATEFRSTIASAARFYEHRAKVPEPTVLSPGEHERLNDLCLNLMRKTDLLEISRELSHELTEILHATQARCLFYDPTTDTLCTEIAGIDEQEPISAAAGLVGYVARTGEQVRLERAARDPRYDSEADSLDDVEVAHFLAQPLVGNAGAIIGVLTVTRLAHLSPFTSVDENRIEALAGRVTPLLHLLVSDLRSQQGSIQGDDLYRNLFRREALEYADYPVNEGKLLRGVPLWLTWSHLIIVVCLVVGVAYVLLAKVHDVVMGPAVVRVTNKITVPALSSGAIVTLLVESGDHVAKGQLLARLQGAPGDSLLARMREEVRAPADGIVTDVNVQLGQAVSVGEQVLSLGGEGSSNEVLALLPGSYAPQIQVGMPLVLKIDGYPQSREVLNILDVTQDIVGPNDAARYVGKEIAQTLSLTGPILIVRSALPQNTFESANERFSYHDGMVARAEVSVRNEPLITTLIPGMKQIYDDPRISLGRAGQSRIWNK